MSRRTLLVVGLVGPALTGTLGGLLVAVGTLDRSTLPTPNPWFVGGRTGEVLQRWLDRDLAGVALALGLAALVAAWLRLRDHPWVAHRAVVAGLVALWALPMLLAPPAFSRDAFAYADLGWTVLSGQSPYAAGLATTGGPWASLVDGAWRGSATPYPPLALLAAAGPVALASMAADEPTRLLLGVALQRLPALVGVGLCVACVPGLARTVGASRQTALWWGVLNPIVVVHLIGGAHNDALALGLGVAALRLAVVRAARDVGRGVDARWGRARRLLALWPLVAAVAVLGSAVAAKQLVALLAVPLGLIAWRRVRASWRSGPPTADGPLARVLDRCGGALAVGVVGALAFGVLVAWGAVTGWGSGWVAGLETPGLFRGPAPIAVASRVWGELSADAGWWPGGVAPFDPWLETGARVVLVVGSIVAVVALGPRRPFTAGAIVSVLGALTQWALFPWYLAGAFVLAGLAGWSWSAVGRAGERWLVGLGVALCGYALLHDYLRLGAWPDLAVGVLVGAAAASVVSSQRREDPRATD